MIQFLQISVSIILFANKIFVLIGKKTGWLLGAIGCTLAIVYLYLIGLYVFTALEFGLVILMLYGFLSGDGRSVRTENLIRIVIVVSMVTMTYFAFAGVMTICELISSAGLLFGTYYLTHNRISLGWTMYCVGYLIAAYIGYRKDQSFFADFQILSAVISLAGVFRDKR